MKQICQIQKDTKFQSVILIIRFFLLLHRFRHAWYTPHDDYTILRQKHLIDFIIILWIC